MSLAKHLLASTRFLWVIAAVTVFVGALSLLILAVFELVGGIVSTFTGHTEDLTLRIILIESVDTILVATVMYVIALGLFQLFVSPDLQFQLPRWLRVSSVGDLESRLTGMSVSVISVILLSQVLEWHGGWDILALGLTVAAVIAAISMFLGVEGRHREEASAAAQNEHIASTAADQQEH